MKKSSIQEQKMAPDEDPLSPWRAAKPRKPLRDLADAQDSPKGRRQEQENESPPNSSHKESTRLESGLRGVGGLDLSQAPGSLGASPALSVSTESKTQTIHFTKLKNSNNTKLTNKNKGKDIRQQSSEGEDDEDEEQPAARCQFVGNQSNRSLGQSPDKSWREASSRSCIINRREEPVKESGSLLQWVFFALLGVVLYFALVGPPTASHPAHNLESEPLSASHWKEMRAMVKDELRALKIQFPNQTNKGFWTLMSATLKAPMHPLPDYPGVLLLLSNPSSRDTANCLASKLVEISSKVLARPGLLPPSVSSLVIPSSTLPNEPAAAKEQLTNKLHTALGDGSAVAIFDLHKIDPIAALTLHAFADNTNAPFKQAVIVSTMLAEEGDCKLEQRAERSLTSLWGPSLGADKLAALLSRLVVAVAEVQPESDYGELCPATS